MPRKDRTFTDKDIIRLVNGNLDAKEQAKVLISLCKGIKIETFDNIDILVPELVREAEIEDVNLVESIIDLFFVILGR